MVSQQRPVDDCPRADHTVVFDDFFVARLTRCAICSAPLHRGWRNLTWECAVPGLGQRLFVIGLVACERCLHDPGWWARLDRRYRQRYHVEAHGEVQVTHEHCGTGQEETPH